MDNWTSVQDTDTWSTSFDVHVAVIDVSHQPVSTTLLFTMFWTESSTWEATDFAVTVVEAAVDPW